MNGADIHILTTRPLANTTMVDAKKQGITIDTVTLIETNSVVDQYIAEEIRKYATEEISVVFTSMNAVEAVLEVLELDDISPEWTIYAMGGTTQQLIKSYFVESEIKATATNSTELANTIIENGEEDVVFFCGNQRRDELPNLLQQHGTSITDVIVYETVEIPVEVSKPYNGILFFSPSAVRSFFSVNKVSSATILFAIGKTTAEALQKESTNKIVMGKFPNKEQLAELAMDHFMAL